MDEAAIKRQFDALLKEMILADGSRHISSPTSMMLYGKKEFLESVQSLAVCRGYRAMLSERKRSSGKNSYWCLNIVERPSVTLKSKDIKWIPYEGKVYCLTTTTSNFVARRNGKVFVTGNSAILKNHEVDLTDRLVKGLNRETGSSIIHGGYTGYVRFKFFDGSHIQSKTIHYDHGHGGGGPATKGVIQAHRRDAYIDGADIICSGHVHESYAIESVHKYLSSNDKIRFRTSVHLCIPPYKEEYKTGRGGYHVEKGRPPKPLGAWWVRFYYEAFSGKIKFDYTRAN